MSSLRYIDENIFEISDAMDAAAAMLYGPVDPVRGKPEELDPDFDGTAMETLENFLIPFPYKVAKCMDPYTYRNIEFDAWTQEMKETSPFRSRNASIRYVVHCMYIFGTPFEMDLLIFF